MAATYSIPERYLDGFRLLAEMDDDRFNTLLTAVSESKAQIRVHSVYHEVAARSNLSMDEIGPPLDAIYSVAALASRENLTPREAAEAIRSDALSVDRAVLTQRVERLLAQDAVRVSVRAVEVSAAGERLTLTARIVTDIRPIFADPGSSDLKPAAAVVLHWLRVDYMEDGESRTFSALMDSEDLKILQGAVERAEAKAASLEALLAKADVAYMPVPGDIDD
jgi:hypothetical protein